MFFKARHLNQSFLPAILAFLFLCSTQLLATPPQNNSATAPVIWEDPGNISSKDLANGLGGVQDRPALPLTFVEEDSGGHNSKFDVKDSKGAKWKAKLGIEAQPETVASRLLWAVGYFTNENYYYPELQVNDLPAHLHRGQGHVVSPNQVNMVRLQRRPDHEKKQNNWKLKDNAFRGQREFNGLRVMMALIGNWDLKDENNAVYTDEDGNQHYLISDVGTAFGASGDRWTEAQSKNNFDAYEHTKFITKVTPKYVNFSFPRFPPFLYIFNLPHFWHQWRLRWIGNKVPREDAKWIGSLLAQLSTQQIEDAFRAGGYPSDQVAAFTKAVQKRIEELNRL